MPPTIYVETTIFGYLTARSTNNVVAAARQQVTQTWWATRRDAFALFVSELVLEEAADGDPEAAERRLAIASRLPLVNVTERALVLAPELQKAGTTSRARRGRCPAHRVGRGTRDGLPVDVEPAAYCKCRTPAPA